MNLLFLDLETTGLNPGKCQILECAAVLVRPGHVNPCADVVNSFIDHRESELVWEPVAFEMHAKSGLLDEWRTRGREAQDFVESQILEALGTCPEKSVRIAGNSIHFDRGFLKVYMPRLDAALHHRNRDVSCLMEFFEEHAALPRTPAKDHRAMPDVRSSMAAYDRLVEWTRCRAVPDAPNAPLPSHDDNVKAYLS